MTPYKFIFIDSRQGLIDLHSAEHKKKKGINSHTHVTTALHNHVIFYSNTSVAGHKQLTVMLLPAKTPPKTKSFF